jgi:RNA polymerase sigma factor (sigma-70 family)
MAVARTLGGEHDRVMDRFTYILEQLRRDGYRRLRAFQPDGSAKFTTWLVVAARRLCVDHERRRYGRRGDAAAASGEERQLRRRLADDALHDGDIDTLVDPDAAPGDAPLLDDERAACLARAVADLPPADQLLLRLRFDEDMTAPEIARLMHFPTQFHVYRRLKALLPQLREKLRDAGFDGADL